MADSVGKTCTLEEDLQDNAIIADCRSILKKYHFTDDEVDLSAESIIRMLDSYR